jgi:hypothetical protein
MTNSTIDSCPRSFGHPIGRTVIADNALVPVAVELQHAEARASGGLTTLSTVIVSLTANGWLYAPTLDPGATPSDLLREHLDLTGIQEGLGPGPTRRMHRTYRREARQFVLGVFGDA